MVARRRSPHWGMVLAVVVALAAAGCGLAADRTATTSSVPAPPASADDPAGFEIVGRVAHLFGSIDTGFDQVVSDLLAEHPQVDTMLLEVVPGSLDDEANLRAGRLVHAAGLTTVVTSESEVASGGTDLFLAGRRRVVEDGALIGVHSWAEGDLTATDVPRGDPRHRTYIDYYLDIGIDPAFYWFTIDAAPADGIHWMTPAEIDRFGIATE